MDRKRKPHQKSRGGCLTCKKRRVKCDENHPTCKRCIRTGWSCSWPPDSPIPSSSSLIPRPSSIDSQPYMYTPEERNVERNPIGTSLLLPARMFQTSRESRYLDAFCSHTLLGSQTSLWQRLVLQIAHTEPVARSAAIALGGLQVDGPDSPHVLCYYGEALAALRGLLARFDVACDSTDVFLTACLLLACFEVGRGDITAAQLHYSRGLDLLSLCHVRLLPSVYRTGHQQNTINIPLPTQGESMERLSLLETRIITLLRACPLSHLKTAQDRSQTPNYPLRWSSPYEVETDREVPSTRRYAPGKIHRDKLLLTSRYEPESDTENLLETERETRPKTDPSAIKESLLGLPPWTQAFSALLDASSSPESHPPSPHRQTIHFLMGISTMLYIRCARDLDLRETGYDAFIPEFEYILAQIERLSIPQSDPDTDQQNRTSAQPLVTFGLRTGILSALQDVCAKCRHRGVRARALELLGRVPLRQGEMDNRNTQMVITAVEAEEQWRVPGVEAAEGIPEERRVVVNLQEGA